MKEVALILTLMDKAARQYALYGVDHPQTEGAIRDFSSRLDAFFQDTPSLKVEVKRSELYWNEEPVFKLEKRERNYIQEMYIDGVRDIEFLPQTTPTELKDFLSVISRDVRNYEVREDDTVTLLWKKGFQNIRYRTVDVFAADLNALLREMVREENLLDSKGEEKNYLDRFIEKLLVGGEESLAGIKPGTAGALSPALAQHVQTPVPLELFNQDDEEVESLSQEAFSVGERNYLSDLGTIFAEVLESIGNPKDIVGPLKSYLTIMRSFLLQGDLRNTYDWLKRLRGVQNHVTQKNPDLQVIIEEEIEKMIDDELLEKLGERTVAGLSATPEDWTNMLRYLGPTSADIVCKLLPYVNQETLHNMFVDYLTSSAPDRTEVYVEHLKQGNWMVVRDMVRVLGVLTKGQNLVSLIRHLAVHPQPELRREVVKTFAHFPGEECHPIIHRALEDSDASVREEAVRYITHHPDFSFAKLLALQVKNQEFLERSSGEKKLSMIALARCGKESSLGFLEQVLREGGSSLPEQELRIAALYGIAEIDEPHAQKILKDFSSKTLLNRKIKDVAKQLWERAQNRETSSNE